MRIRNDVVISKNPRSKDKPWTVRWWGKYDVDKEAQPRFSKSFEIKKKAEQYAATLKRDISDGISTELQTITLEQLWEKFQKTAKMRVKNTSLSSYQITAKRLINYFGPNRNIKTIRREDAEEFISDVRLFKDNADPSDSSRDKEMRNAKLIFSKAVEWDYIRKNPFSKITLGKIKKNGWHFITFPEFKALLSAIENSRERDKHEKEDIERKYRLKA